MYKKLSGFGLSDIQIKSVMKLYEERDMFRSAEENLLKSIKEYGARNADIVKKLLPKDSLKFENGKIIGYEDELKKMRSNPETAFLFEDEKIERDSNEVYENDDIFTGIIPSESEDNTLDENLSYEDLCEIL